MGNGIEILVSDKATNTEKGRILEELGKELLSILQYDVVDEIRITAMEVDLLAKHRINGEIIFVECKAHQNNLSADVFTKLLGNVVFKGVSAGWLFTTGPLGKDAKGFQEEWNQKLPEQRRTLSIYTSDKLVELLINSGKICNPIRLNRNDKYTFSEENTLLITEYGRFWAIKVMHVSAGVPYGVVLYDAETSRNINDKDVINLVSKLSSSLSDLDFLTSDSGEISATEEITEELSNIATVTGGDQWADYRPSRPKDFVGREDLQRDIFRFCSSVVDNDSNTRLLAIKAPSGWGKSSVLLKLVSKSKIKRYKTKYFIHAVDVRAATSRRYSEFSLLSCINSAISEGFVTKPAKEITINSINNPLSSEGIVELLQSLKEENKVLVLFFDQFEEIFSKNELADLFDSIRKLALAIDSARENIILGFAWKTDGTTPTDHPAYYMWQSLSDRRREFQLSTFTPKEINRALSLFSKELGEALNPNLKKYLIDHCQGYPWLLKKLCIHVYSLINNGTEQGEIMGKGLDIESLFERDLNELSSPEIACLKRIASESPADFFKVDQDFGSETLHTLLNKRLIIRKGHKLILYWDIFRDYVLTGSVPQITITYIPQVNLNKYNDLLQLLLNEKEMTLIDIANNLKIGIKASDNLVRDMVMFGNVTRQGEKITIIQESEFEAVNKLYEFFNSHILLKTLIEQHGEGFNVTTQEFEKTFINLYKESQYSKKTLNTYIKKVMSWLLGLGIIRWENGYIVHFAELSTKSITTKQLLSSRDRITVNARMHPFLGAAPAERVLDLIKNIRDGIDNETDLKALGLRNAITVLNSLGLGIKQADKIKLINVSDDCKLIVANKVMETETIKLINSYREEYGRLPESKEVGTLVSDFLNKEWKETSKTRTGLALLKWHKWATEISNEAAKVKV
ncbi:nSTAND1 domain-containing NTPase [Bacillus cereus group sp. Bce041]|uniref:nSTAND1 domain-containing NTPase n=1 Tax=Bacillus cereus group sp. Bce041 TaxID=3445228 RepID=UPI004041C0AC